MRVIICGHHSSKRGYLSLPFSIIAVCECIARANKAQIKEKRESECLQEAETKDSRNVCRSFFRKRRLMGFVGYVLAESYKNWQGAGSESPESAIQNGFFCCFDHVNRFRASCMTVLATGRQLSKP